MSQPCCTRAFPPANSSSDSDDSHDHKSCVQKQVGLHDGPVLGLHRAAVAPAPHPWAPPQQKLPFLVDPMQSWGQVTQSSPAQGSHLRSPHLDLSLHWVGGGKGGGGGGGGGGGTSITSVSVAMVPLPCEVLAPLLLLLLVLLLVVVVRVDPMVPIVPTAMVVAGALPLHWPARVALHTWITAPGELPLAEAAPSWSTSCDPPLPLTTTWPPTLAVPSTDDMSGF
jgi:hypothetical protein